MYRTCYVSVSDAALCQKCPALMAYKLLKGRKDAWKTGIKGNGYYYGTVFHKEIAQVFFEGAADRGNILHGMIARSISEGAKALETVIRENIFIPFLSAKSECYDSSQILAMADGIRVWVRAMYEFFTDIPSLMRSPEKFMSTVFMKPEQKLQGIYNFRDGRLIVTGCYDALLFNPDRGEARLFEFKGYMKSDIAVPLSQSLMYSWLIWRYSGIIPSVEIIYLGDGGREPEIFDSQCVRSMIISGLPGLFSSVYGVLSAGRVPEFFRDNNLCSQCRYSGHCVKDWRTAKI